MWESLAQMLKCIVFPWLLFNYYSHIFFTHKSSKYLNRFLIRFFRLKQKKSILLNSKLFLKHLTSWARLSLKGTKGTLSFQILQIWVKVTLCHSFIYRFMKSGGVFSWNSIQVVKNQHAWEDPKVWSLEILQLPSMNMSLTFRKTYYPEKLS